ncbi:MAG: hypothetical protein CL534_25075 [Ahrensia sp.]|nr:hypothetical protein [Ahrensia sp.]
MQAGFFSARSPGCFFHQMNHDFHVYCRKRQRSLQRFGPPSRPEPMNDARDAERPLFDSENL